MYYLGVHLMDRPDSITIRTRGIKEVFADKVDVFIKIEGSSFFTGNQALEKAQELSSLVKDLLDYGLSERDIFLESVSANEHKGIIGQSSSATYSLRITCDTLDNLADILGIITSQKNISLSYLEWKYSNIEKMHDSLLEECLDKAKIKAEKVAAKLNVKLLGVWDFIEEPTGSEIDEKYPIRNLNLVGNGAVAKLNRESFGLSVSHKKTIILQIIVKYRVSEFSNDANNI